MAEFAIVENAARTGTTGTQDFTVSGFGTPKGAIFILTYATSNGTVVDHAMLSIGGTDGTDSRVMAYVAEDNVNPVDCGSSGNITNAVISLLNTNQAVDGLATFSTWITDGVRINWTDVPPTGYLVKCILIGGTGVSNCKVGNATTPGVVGNATDVTTVGFESSLVFTWSLAEDTLTSASNCVPTLGIVVNDGSNTQRSLSMWSGSSITPSQNSLIFDTASVARRAITGASGAEAQIQGFDASGFDLFQRIATPIIQLNFMAIKLNGISAKLLTSASPTTTGTHTISGVGFTPQFGLMLHSSCLAVDTVYTDTNSEVYGISAFTAITSASAAISIADAVATSNTESISNNIAVSLRKGAAAFMTATFSAFTNDGASFSYSAVDASARQRAVLFIERNDAVITADSGSFTLSGIATVLRTTATTWLRLRK